MANLTTESAVREKFQLTDTTLVPSALVVQSIDDAHGEVLRFIDPDVDLVTPDAMLVLGETLLAGAHLLRSLASQDAFQQKRVAVGGARLDEGKRFTNLLEFSAQTEVQAWKTLEPFLKDRPSERIAVVTDTVPVLGGQ